VPPCCHTGSSTTTPTDPTAPSADAHRSAAFTTSRGRTPRRRLSTRSPSAFSACAKPGVVSFSDNGANRRVASCHLARAVGRAYPLRRLRQTVDEGGSPLAITLDGRTRLDDMLGEIASSISPVCLPRGGLETLPNTDPSILAWNRVRPWSGSCNLACAVFDANSERSVPA
jgi:hypothetical protein